MKKYIMHLAFVATFLMPCTSYSHVTCGGTQCDESCDCNGGCEDNSDCASGKQCMSGDCGCCSANSGLERKSDTAKTRASKKK